MFDSGEYANYGVLGWLHDPEVGFARNGLLAAPDDEMSKKNVNHLFNKLLCEFDGPPHSMLLWQTWQKPVRVAAHSPRFPPVPTEANGLSLTKTWNF